jgi:phosphonate transport system substrate-binding protein
MKALQFATIVCVCSLALFPRANADGAPVKELRIVFIAYQNPEQIIEDVRPVVAYLEQELGVPVKHFVATGYAGVIEALKNSTADMGFMGPLQYVIAHQHAGAIPILGEVYQGKPYYHSRIFVRKDSGIAKLADLKNKTMAFTDPISSSGYLYPLDLFTSEGLIEDKPEGYFKRVYFAGGDEQAIRAVYNGFVDAAGIGQFAYNLLRPEERDAIVFIGESKRLPSHCVVVRKGLPVEAVADLKKSLLALNGGPNENLLQMLYGVDGYVEVDHEDFQEVEKIARAHGIIK